MNEKKRLVNVTGREEINVKVSARIFAIDWAGIEKKKMLGLDDEVRSRKA